MPKLVATDLDGTLLHSDGTVTDRTREVLDALDAQGVTVVFVTGRPIRWMEPLWHHVGDHGLAICSNGGIVYDVPGRSVRRGADDPPRGRARGRRPGPQPRSPGRRSRSRRPPASARSRRSSRGADDAGKPELTIGPLEEIFDDSVVKLLALHLELAPEEYWAQVEQLVGHASRRPGRRSGRWSR